MHLNQFWAFYFVETAYERGIFECWICFPDILEMSLALLQVRRLWLVANASLVGGGARTRSGRLSWHQLNVPAQPSPGMQRT